MTGHDTTSSCAVSDPEGFLRELFDVALAAADPAALLAQHLPTDTTQPALVIGAGKAAAAMAASLERHWQGPLRGLVVTPYGHGLPTSCIEVVEAAHPVPDEQSETTAQRIFAMVDKLQPDDLVICLLSGGGSSLLAAPAPGLTLADKRAISQALLRSGATITDMNCVRKHLSAIKGGRLAARCYPARVLTYALSDVPGDEGNVIASGPTVGDPTSSEDARDILQRYQIEVPERVHRWLVDDRSETLKPEDEELANSKYKIVGTPRIALEAAHQHASRSGVEVVSLGVDINGEAGEVAREHAAVLRSLIKSRKPGSATCVILSGGETVVVVAGTGRGGRNTHYLLSLAEQLRGEPGVYALAADTDGIDGAGDNAGAVFSPASWSAGLERGLDAKRLLENSDSYHYFESLEDLLITGPTRTNVNDFRAILVCADRLGKTEGQ